MLTKDRPEDALLAFKACRTESGPRNDEDAIADEFHLLHMQVMVEMKEFVPLKEFFTRPALRKRCIIGFLTMVGAQSTGSIVINSESLQSTVNYAPPADLVIDYGPFLYRKLGFSVVNQLLIQCAWITVALANAINALLIDRLGRVRMLGEYPHSTSS